MVEFTGAKVFTATKAKERESLGDVITQWIKEHPEYRVVDREALQSSDNEFHCLSIIVYYTERDDA
jgi:hypothetical protein